MQAIGAEDAQRGDARARRRRRWSRSVPDSRRSARGRVGTQAEDVVDADDDVVGELEQSTVAAQSGFGATCTTPSPSDR